MDRNMRIVLQIGTGFKPYRNMFSEFKKKRKKKKKKKKVTTTNFLQRKTLNIKKFFLEGGVVEKFNYTRISLFAVSSNLNSTKRR